jgi:hypothetical protein
MTRWPAIIGLSLALLGPAGAAPNEKPAANAPDAVVVDEPTAGIIRGALKYLAAKQKPNGAWEDGRADWSAAITGYALIAFMATGNLPGEGEYGKVVTAGMQRLLDTMQADGTFAPRTGQYMYGHGVATIALAELYGQTKSAALRTKLEKAVKVILGAQNNEGGWRYHPRVGDADISVTVLQVVALRAAKNAGLDVPQDNIDRAIKYVNSCYEERTGGFCYQPGKGAGFARTAAAIYSLQVCGQYADRRVKTGSEYLMRESKGGKGGEWFTYGHFYAAPAQYMIGGETWRKWYEQTRATLVKGVRRQGDLAYWDTELDRRAAGPVYCTAVYTTILALPYHYIPLYQR